MKMVIRDIVETTVILIIGSVLFFGITVWFCDRYGYEDYDLKITRLENEMTELREYSEQLCREYHAMARDLERHLNEVEK